MKKKYLVFLLLLVVFLSDSVCAKTTYSKPTNSVPIQRVTERVTSTCYYYKSTSKSDLIRVEFGRYLTGSVDNGNPSNYSNGFKLKRISTNTFFNIYQNVTGKYDDTYKEMIISSSNCEDILFYESDSAFSWVVLKKENYDDIVYFCSKYSSAVKYCNYAEDGDVANCTSTVTSCDDISSLSSSSGGSYDFTDPDDPDIFEKDANGCPMIIKLPVFFIKKVVFNVLQIFVPIILIVMSNVELVKYVLNPDDKKSASLRKCMNRFIIAVMFFFITTIVSLVLNAVSNTTDIKHTSDWRNCWISIK